MLPYLTVNEDYASLILVDRYLKAHLSLVAFHCLLFSTSHSFFKLFLLPIRFYISNFYLIWILECSNIEHLSSKSLSSHLKKTFYCSSRLVILSWVVLLFKERNLIYSKVDTDRLRKEKRVEITHMFKNVREKQGSNSSLELISI